MKEEIQKAILNNKTIKMVNPDLEDIYLEIEKEKLTCKNNEQHIVHYYKNTNQTVCTICGTIN